MPKKNTFDNVIAVVPAAGKANRLPSINCSKEILPIGYLNPSQRKTAMDKPVCFHLMEKFAYANIKHGILIIRAEKWDIPKSLGSGKCVNMEIAYQMLDLPYGTAFTINQAYPFVKNNIVAIGFPDILFSATDAYLQILNKLVSSDADVVLGLFPADRPTKVDMVEVDRYDNVINIIIKPQSTNLLLTWGVAAWKPSFTIFLNEYLAARKHRQSDPELHIGNVIHHAIKRGLNIKAQKVSDTPYLDMGTPDDLARAIKQFSR